eukprot:5500726-Prymnesium_polylepis.1
MIRGSRGCAQAAMATHRGNAASRHSEARRPLRTWPAQVHADSALSSHPQASVEMARRSRHTRRR